MKKHLIGILLSFSSVVFSQEIPDSLLTIDYIYNYTFSDYDKSIRIAQLMRERKLAETFQLDMAEGDLYFNNGKYHQALKFYNRAMESDSVRLNDERTMKLLHRFISVYDCLHNDGKGAEVIGQLLVKAREVGDPVMESIAQFNLGKMIYYQKDTTRGYQLVREAIRLMEESDYEYKNDNLVFNYQSLYTMYQRDLRHEEALAVHNKLAEVITGATDEHYNMEGINRKELKALYADRAYIYSKLGRKAEAAAFYEKWKTMDNINNKDNYMIIPYLMTVGKYKEVIAVNQEHQDFMYSHNDTINYHMVTVKRTNGRAYEAMGNYRMSSQYFIELSVLIDSLKTREQKSAALELATVYETTEKESEIQQQRFDLRVRNVLLGSALVAILLLGTILWHSMRSARVIRRKNAAMANSIDELITYKEELRVLKEAQDAESKTETSSNENQILFARLDDIVVTQKLYLNRSISREDLLKLIEVDKNRFGQMMKQETGISLTGYLNSYRLEYATRLMKENPEMEVSKVAEMSALPNSSTFYRLFKDRFGMTPVEYMEAVKRRGTHK